MKVPKDAFVGLPKERPPVSLVEGMRGVEGVALFNWADLVSHYVHPLKVAIIEALLWVEQPLSANDLARLFAVRHYPLGVVAYHVSDLAKRGVIEQVAERQARGARECFYFLAS
jgi:hypothetical protein